MRAKAIIRGFKNSQKFRFILTCGNSETVGLTLTLQQMSDGFATTQARMAVLNAIGRLAYDRREAKRNGKPLPTGILQDAPGFRHVQVDMH